MRDREELKMIVVFFITGYTLFVGIGLLILHFAEPDAMNRYLHQALCIPFVFAAFSAVLLLIIYVWHRLQGRDITGEPLGIVRVDRGRLDGVEIPHVHFDNGAALNVDGTWKHGYIELTNAQKQRLKKWGWRLPE